jgi:chromosome segregation ATPase
MHKSGVVFAWLVVVAAIAAVPLTAKVLAVRSSWQQAVEKNSAQIAKNEAEIEAKSEESADLRGQLTRIMLGWDRYWDANVTVNPQSGEIQVNIGGNQGLGSAQDNAAAKPVIFAFQAAPGQPGGVSYVGVFRVQALEANRALLKKITPPEQGETAQWKNGTWRLRALVPSNYITTLRTLRDQLVERKQQLKRKQDRIEDLNRLLASAQERLDARVSELIGSDNAPQGENLPVELRKGLVAGLEEEEQERNQEFQETDQLRRDLLKVFQEQQKLIDEVTQLTRQLPQQNQGYGEQKQETSDKLTEATAQ